MLRPFMGVGVGVTRDALCRNDHLHFSTLIAKWQRRCDRLSGLMRRMTFPQLETFEIDGERFSLPLSAVDPPVESPTNAELEYLVGFFDGDGCVTTNVASRNISLQFGQRLGSASVLLRFRAAFRGGIYRGARPTGSSEATLRWIVSGPTMRHAAGILASVPSMKQAQLRLAAAYEKGQLVCWSQVAKDLKMLKGKDHIPSSIACSWPYLAGFFDAEGNVSVKPDCASLSLTVAQVNHQVLQSWLKFLLANRLDRWRLYKFATHSLLSCKHRETRERTLGHLLVHGLSLKKDQAALALKLTDENHLKIRDAISKSGGKQSRYQRLNTDGIARAKEICKLQHQLRLTTCKQNGNRLALELAQLKEEHAVQKLKDGCSLLRADIRARLPDGGTVATYCTLTNLLTLFDFEPIKERIRCQRLCA